MQKNNEQLINFHRIGNNKSNLSTLYYVYARAHSQADPQIDISPAFNHVDRVTNNPFQEQMHEPRDTDAASPN